MRYYEILAEAAIPRARRHMIDPETGLRMNNPSTWSQSPYLGAVKSPDGSSYKAQIHIPQDTWYNVIDSQSEKWHQAELPKSFYEPVGKRRHTIVMTGFRDPRQAAWLVQAILHDETADRDGLIEDALEGKYIHNMTIREVWADILAEMPTYDGTPLVDGDQEIWLELHREANPPRERPVPQGREPDLLRNRRPDLRPSRQETLADRQAPAIKKSIIDYMRKRKKYKNKATGGGRSMAEFEQIADSVFAGENGNIFFKPNTVVLRNIADVMKDIDLSKYI